MDDRIDRLRRDLEQVRDEVHVQGVRLTMAQAFIGFLHKAYDALLHHGVNYRSLKEYNEDEVLSDAAELPVTGARNKIVLWLRRIESAIEAAIRRKGFKVH